jgi:hypothetical protein
MQCPSDLRTLARLLGGDVIGRQVIAPGPGHSSKDRSLSVTISTTAPEGFLAFSHAGDDFQTCRDHIINRLGLDPDTWKTRVQKPEPRPEPIKDNGRNLEIARRIIREIESSAKLSQSRARPASGISLRRGASVPRLLRTSWVESTRSAGILMQFSAQQNWPAMT